jgi:hypothetical protein
MEQTPERFRALIVPDVAKWAKVVELAGLEATD